MIECNGVEIKPTIFPDHTSQVWKLPEDLLKEIDKINQASITWNFENESEFLHLAQLKTLLDTYAEYVYLTIPFLPYARQDKRVDNNSTFALKTFCQLLNSLNFTSVSVVDVHNSERAKAIKNIEYISPRNRIASVIYELNHEEPSVTLLFPDQGALKRYGNYNLGAYIVADKEREQATGRITKFVLNGTAKGERLLILDDLADGGHTFCLAAEAAINAGAEAVFLFVSHGLFTQGIKKLHDAGISRIFTYDKEVTLLEAVK